MMTASRASLLLCVLGGLLSCSTGVSTSRQRECGPTRPCEPGFICSEALTCVDARLDPPRLFLAFDVQERGLAGSTPEFRVEVAGCDREVELESLESGGRRRQIPIDRTRVAQTFLLSAQTEIEPGMDGPIASSFKLSQPSRFFRNPLITDVTRRYAPESGGASPAPVAIDWARHHPDDAALSSTLGPGGYVLWTLSPDAVAPFAAPASRYEMLVPPSWTSEPCVSDLQCCAEGACTVRGACLSTWGFCRPLPVSDSTPARFEFRSAYDGYCDRGLSGKVTLLEDPTVPIGGATVSIRHADLEDSACMAEEVQNPLTLAPLDPVGFSVPTDDQAPDHCLDDSECASGQLCSPALERCVLKLDGMAAGNASTARTDPDNEVTDGGTFTARVYTYCEDRRTQRNCRGYALTVTPPSDSVLPAINFEVEGQHDAFNPDTHPSAAIRNDLCIPDWGSPYTLPVLPTGDPVVLAGAGTARPYACCDVSCLPATAEDAASGAPIPRNSCSGRSAAGTPVIRFETTLQYTDALKDAWEDETRQCHAPAVGDDQIIGSLRRTADCPSDNALCSVRIATGTSDDPRLYTVRVEAPSGSLLGSVALTFDATDLASQEEPPQFSIPLPRRALVRGVVRLSSDLCAGDADNLDCDVENALVLAERLRRAGETEANTPGPYFHQVQTHFDPDTQTPGAFVLPLDPGTYIITALPGPRSEGGPARLQLFEIREDTDLGELILEPGLAVTVYASAFDRDAQITPFDTGSWIATRLTHPERAGGLVDLNAPGECLVDTSADSLRAGCSIRRLLAVASQSLTQVQEIQFTARNSPNASLCSP